MKVRTMKRNTKTKKTNALSLPPQTAVDLRELYQNIKLKIISSSFHKKPISNILKCI